MHSCQPLCPSHSANANRSRRKSCQACADGKTKCDLQQPCSRCKARERECVYVRTPTPRRKRSPTNATSCTGPSSSPEGEGNTGLPPVSDISLVESPTSPTRPLASSASAPQLFYTNPALAQGLSTPQIPFGPSNTFHDFRDADSLSSYASSAFSGNTENIAQNGSMGMFGSGSFAQDALEVNNQLNALFSTELFDKFFRDAVDESSVGSMDSGGGLQNVKDMMPFDNTQFPFPIPSDSADVQPFMGSMPPPDLDMFALPSEFMASANISNTRTAVPPQPLASSYSSSALPSPAVEPSLIPYPSELQQYSAYFLVLSSQTEANSRHQSIYSITCFSRRCLSCTSALSPSTGGRTSSSPPCRRAELCTSRRLPQPSSSMLRSPLRGISS